MEDFNISKKCELYPYVVYVTDMDADFINKNYKYANGDSLNTEGDPYMRTFNEVKGNKGYGSLVWVRCDANEENRNIVSSVAAHEAFHIANGMCEYLNLFYTTDKDEHIAYLIQYITKVILDVIYGNSCDCNK